MIRKYTILALLVALTYICQAQSKTIRIEARNQPLNAVLLQLRDQYDFQFSYSESQLSGYTVTVSKTFNSKEETVKYLLKDLPFHLKITRDVFIIIPEKKKPKTYKDKAGTQFNGQIVEAGTFEPLPFSNIMINDHPLVADVTGSFKYTALPDSSFRIRISHLGYYICDTTLYSGTDQQFKLTPSIVKLPEVVIQNSLIEKATMVGESTGKITMNHNIARFLPGQGDNSVFNMIRLMPGVQAAGEQSNDVLIWGSYEGQSLLTFDEFTLFGLKNYCDNISVVNPFVVKNIEVYKGGFDSKYGNRIGGIVNITGKNGSLKKPVFSLNMNTTTINGMVEIPLLKKSSLLMAYRQTYYNLYNSDDFNIFAPTRPKNSNFSKASQQKTSIDFNVYPDDYQFRDMNLKYTFNFDNSDQFYISAYGGGDDFLLATDAAVTRTRILKPKEEITLLELNLRDREENVQRGISAFYNRNWNNQMLTKFVLTHSDFSRILTEDLQSTSLINDIPDNRERNNTGNKASEQSLRIENILNLSNGQRLEFGGGVYLNEAEIESNINLLDTLMIENLNNYKNNRAFLYLEDNFPIGKRLNIKAGVRLNMTLNQPEFYFEPRLSGTYRITENLKLNASLGRYYQYMFKVASIDKDLNYSYLWVTANNDIPVQDAMHYAGGINYFRNNLTFNAEAYYKMSHQLTERVFEKRKIGRKGVFGYYPYFGNAKTWGLDLYAKKDFGKHSVWASYTLSKALESFAPENKPLPEYTYAPQHQLHELKMAAIFSVGKFYFSTDYVYGSGLELIKEVFADETEQVSYNRLDVAATYKFTPKRFSGEVGFSIINLFDTQNLKYDNLKTIRLGQNYGDIRVYSNSIPFTPVIFLKLLF
jgi:hypothetical protein